MSESAPDGRRRLMSERRRSTFSLGVAVVVALLVVAITDVSITDVAVFGLLAYIATYLVATLAAFGRATASEIEDWAEREERGTVLQRYVLGSAPGPGVSLFFAGAALVVAMIWLPGHGGGNLPPALRVGVAIVLIVAAWASVLVSYAVTFYADNVVEEPRGLVFPDGTRGTWSDYIYFATSVMTTFGTTDVDVVSPDIRRTVTANAIIAFVFNTVTVATAVSALAG